MSCSFTPVQKELFLLFSHSVDNSLSLFLSLCKGYNFDSQIFENIPANIVKPDKIWLVRTFEVLLTI